MKKGVRAEENSTLSGGEFEADLFLLLVVKKKLVQAEIQPDGEQRASSCSTAGARTDVNKSGAHVLGLRWDLGEITM